MTNRDNEPPFDGDDLPLDVEALLRDFPRRLDLLKEASGLSWSGLARAIGVDRKQTRRWAGTPNPVAVPYSPSSTSAAGSPAAWTSSWAGSPSRNSPTMRTRRRNRRAAKPRPRPIPRRRPSPRPRRQPSQRGTARGRLIQIPRRPRDMKDFNGQEQPKRRGRPPRDAPELRVVGIDFKSAPDAQDRLRRLFTILAGLVVDEPPMPGMDPPQEEVSGPEA